MSPGGQLRLAESINSILSLQDAARPLNPAAAVEGLTARILEPGTAPTEVAAAQTILAALADPLIAAHAIADLRKIQDSRFSEAGTKASAALNRFAGENASVQAVAAKSAAALGLDLSTFFDGAADPKYFLGDLRFDVPALKETGGFVVPNERHPEDMRAILDTNPGGAYVTVGAERGFIAAAMPGITHLVLADIDPDINTYNRTNVALLRLGRTRKEYVELRTNASKQLWVKLARDRGLADLLPLLDDEANIKAWRKYQKNNLDASGFALVRDAWHRAISAQLVRIGLVWDPYQENRKPEFVGGNYLRDDALFSKLKSMAERGRIQSILMDLNDEKAARALPAALAVANIPLAVLDLSNVWEDAYLKARPVITLVKAFAKIAARDSILLATEGGKAAPGYYGPRPWKYYGFRFGDLLLRDNLAEALRDVFGYGLRGYEANTMNTPTQPKDMRERSHPSFWWTKDHIDAN